MVEEGSSPDRLDDVLRALRADDAQGRMRPLVEYASRAPERGAEIAAAYLAAARAGGEDAEAGDAANRIGNYRLLRELGRGGQGVVYLAEDTRLGRRVALKVLTALGPGSEETLRRFWREAEITSKLDHAGICVVHDVGVSRSVAFIAMQYVQGVTLSRRIADAKCSGGDGATSWVAVATGDEDFELELEGESGEDDEREESSSSANSADRQEIRDILLLFEKAARALHAAHEAGVVHRDVKPGNIMVTAAGDPVIVDFGLARDDDLDFETLTRSGDLFGTPAYMSPEQISRARMHVDRRTDVYSLGASLYECLTLSRPFCEPTRERLYFAIMTREAPPLRRLNPRVSKDLAVVVHTAMEKDRDRRYQTALEFADELRRVQERVPIVARPVGPWTRTVRWAQRNPAVATLLATIVLGLTGGLVWSSITNRELTDLNAALSATMRGLADKTAEAEENARRAAAETEAKGAALAEYQRMADARRLANARAEADELWPVTPQLTPRLESWQETYAPLFARLDDHARALERLRRIAVVCGEGEERTWDFGEDVDAQFRHDTLARLVADMRAFCDPEAGVVPSIERRLWESRRIDQETVEGPREDWAAAAERVARHAGFGGLELAPQTGLVPLGPDPASGLEEFLDWQTHVRLSGAGPPPPRGPGGRFSPDAATGIVFVLVPGGRFLMGAQATEPSGPNHDPDARPEESPIVGVELLPYLVSKWEMTQAQWMAVMGSNPSRYPVGWKNDQVLPEPVSGAHPVERVSWHDCREAMRRLGCVLPTEAQWERAAQAGRFSVYASTSDITELGRYGNIAGREMKGLFTNRTDEHEDPFGLHAPVGSFLPNAFGLHDMTGNVWEWCLDSPSKYADPPREGDGLRSGPQELRICRGGCFSVPAVEARLANRLRRASGDRSGNLGVRPARPLQ